MYHYWLLLTLLTVLSPVKSERFDGFLIKSTYTDQHQRKIQSSISLAVDTDTNLLYTCVTYSQLSTDDSIQILIQDSSNSSPEE